MWNLFQIEHDKKIRDEQGDQLREVAPMTRPVVNEQYRTVVINPRFCYLTPKCRTDSNMAQEISHGLTRRKRFIHPKFFYDKTGSRLFDEICKLPEYYLTRSETEILDKIGSALSGFLENDCVLIELGSGSAIKTSKLLEVLSQKQEVVEYYPIDISEILKESSISLQRRYQNLKITGILDHYEGGLEFARSLEKKKIIAFLGSSLGNFDNKNAVEFLHRVKEVMREGDFFLLGLDMVKDRRILESAYNDSKGVTARFNLNLLTRINRELGGNFNLQNFEHKAIYNSRYNRIEMYMRSIIDQEAFISKINLTVKLRKGEMILTEYSHKYTRPQIEQIADCVGFKIEHMWYDKSKFFALVFFSAFS